MLPVCYPRSRMVTIHSTQSTSISRVGIEGNPRVSRSLIAASSLVRRRRFVVAWSARRRTRRHGRLDQRRRVIGMTKIDATDLTAMTDEELASLRATAALDSRHDPEASERLAVFEEEIARRLVAETREEAAEAERTRREIAGFTDAELEARRARLGGESPSVVREELEARRRRAAEASGRPGRRGRARGPGGGTEGQGGGSRVGVDAVGLRGSDEGPGRRDRREVERPSRGLRRAAELAERPGARLRAGGRRPSGGARSSRPAPGTGLEPPPDDEDHGADLREGGERWQTD
jgi:hypothetical protein